MSDSSSSSECETVVQDNGSGMCYAGFAGDDAPRDVFPSVIGTPRRKSQMVGVGYSEHYIGDRAQMMRGVLSLDYPIEHGIVTNWDNMEKIWEYVHRSLHIDPKECRFVLPEAPLNPKANREKMAQVMFETYDACSLIIPDTSKLSLYSSGRGSGIVFDSGDGVTTAYPIYEGHHFKTAVKRIDFAGSDLTHYLMKLLNDNDNNGSRKYVTTADREIAREIKEKVCYVAMDYNEKITSPLLEEKSYKLPDGQLVTLGKEVFQCPEALFKPSLFNMEFPGVHEMVYSSIMDCDIYTRSLFFGNVVVNGRSTMFPGFPQRMTSELTNLIPKTMKCKVVAAPERAYSVWIGGSILGSLSITTFISRKQYNEYGPSVVSRIKEC